MVNVPHFDYPFRFGTNGGAVVIEQNDQKDVMNCIVAACKTRRGTRLFVPNFGISDPTFQTMPLDQTTLEAEIRESEPRADVGMLEKIDGLIDYVTLGVGTLE